MPYELDQNPFRPDICLGTDSFHTPEQLTSDIQRFLSDKGLSSMINRPFSGTYVPLKLYGSDKRVVSIMIEVNRMLYMNEATGERLSGYDEAREMFTDFIRMIISNPD